MIIKYIGHACFKVRDNETGYSIIFDPYQPGSVPGFHDIVDLASEVICSHEHFDHNARECVKIEAKNDSPFEVLAIDTWHDEEEGALRGPNRIHIIIDKKTGEKVVHLGDIGELPKKLLACSSPSKSTPSEGNSASNLELLRDADVMMIPVGGIYTYDADQAIELIKETTPNVVIPMHYKIADGYGLSNIGTVMEFASKAQAAGLDIRTSKYAFYDTEVKLHSDNGTSVILVRPQNM